MDDFNLHNSGPNVSITIKKADLIHYSDEVADKAIARYRAELAANPEEFYYSTERVCQILDVDKSTLHRWNKRNYLNSIRVGGLLRYRKSDVDNILKVRKQ